MAKLLKSNSVSRSLSLISLLFFVSLLLVSCASPIKLYNGENRTVSEVALFKIGSMGQLPNDFLYKVDGKYGPDLSFGQAMFLPNGTFGGLKIELLPGAHTLEIGPGRSSPVITVNFVAEAGKVYEIEGIHRSDCIKIVETKSKKFVSELACPESISVVSDSKEGSSYSVLNVGGEKSLLRGMSLIIYKIDDRWDNKAKLGWNYFNFSKQSLKLSPGEHKLEIGYAWDGRKAVAPQTISFLFESGKTYVLSAKISKNTAGEETWEPVIELTANQ